MRQLSRGCLGFLLLVYCSAVPVAVRVSAPSVPRRVRISGQSFVDTASNSPYVIAGPNVVVKGPPYLPSVSGSTVCNDVVNHECAATGTCTSCSTFNEADVRHIQSLGWNSIRLGVVWAGAQPRDENALDPAFLGRLHALLNLTDHFNISVILDSHGDMVGSAGCGNGVPMWFSKRAAPKLIGKPLFTDLPFSLIPDLRVDHLNGYDTCGDNETLWAEHAGDPNYNILNQCCVAINSPNPPGIGYTALSQKTMEYMVNPGPGRDAFVRYWTLMAGAVREHPSAFAAELFNEPMTIRRRASYDTWKACAQAINAIIPDMAVSVCDIGEGAIIPAWVSRFAGEDFDISHETVEWMRQSSTLFYAWHWYGEPSKKHALANVRAIMKDWNMPLIATESMDCGLWDTMRAENMSRTYWHYSSYCTTGPAFGNRTVPTNTFGACILGWAGGRDTHCEQPDTALPRGT